MADPQICQGHRLFWLSPPLSLGTLVILTAAGILVLWLLPCRMKEKGEEEEDAVTFFKDACRGVDMTVQVISHWPELRSSGRPYTREAVNVCEVCILQSFLLS